MSRIEILIYLMKHYNRQSRFMLEFKLKQLSPELEALAPMIRFFQLAFILVYPILLMFVHIDRIPYVDNVDAKWVVLFLVSCFIGFSYHGLSFKNPVLERYHFKLYLLNAIFSKRILFLNLLAIHIVCFKFFVYQSIAVLPIFLIEIGILVILLIWKKARFKHIKKMSLSVSGILALFLLLSSFNTYQPFFESILKSLAGETVIAVILMFSVLKFINGYLKRHRIEDVELKQISGDPSYTAIIFLMMIELMKANAFFVNLSVELVFFAFFFIVLLKNTKHFYLLSYEGYQSFLFYLKNIDYPFKKIIIKKILVFFYVMGADCLLFVFYLVFEGKINFAFIFLLLTALDVSLGLTLSLIYPTKLDAKDRLQLYHHSKFQLSTVLILIVTMGIVAQKILFVLHISSLLEVINHKTLDLIEMFVGISVFIINLFTVYFLIIWTKTFFSKLYADQYDSEKGG
ncbi:hypothetical protein VSK91_01205 [Bacillus swezeyi]|uniref:hypothetical protein n=2 Tax=Bacillus swezeyi TaxID=1925020 RepID=UPI0039C5E29D